jgi:curved DNA-binding protein
VAETGGKDLYAVLGVPRDASEDQIRKAYRQLARRYHPDVNPNDKAAEERFKEISYAYDVLSDSEKRSRYDEFGAESLASGFDPEQARAWRRWSEGARRSPVHETFEEIDLEDLISRLGGLGGLGGAARAQGFRGPRRGRDLHAEVEVPFADVVLAREVRLAPAGRSALRVRIPPGAEDGTRVRLAGQGEPGASGAPPGDLYLTLRVRPDPLFRRDGDDLSFDLPVTVPELVLGASVEVPTPEGSATVRIPPHSRPGQRLRLRGKGATRRGGERGDLYVRLVAELPAGRDDELEEIAKRMEPLYGSSDVRAGLRRGGSSGGAGT